MDSVNSPKAVELCTELIEFAFLAGPTCDDCPARRFCEDEQEYDLDSVERPEDDCKVTALRWLSYKLGIPYAFNCEKGYGHH